MKNLTLFAIGINITNFIIAIFQHNFTAFCGWFAATIYTIILYQKEK